MATVDVGFDSFSRMVESEGTVIVDFWAEWCGPCRAFAPRFAEVSEEFPEVKFAKVDTEAEAGLAGALGIRSIPTIMVFRDGVLLYREAGALPKAALQDLLIRVADLDMDDVRRRLAEEKPAGDTGGSHDA